MILDTKFFSSKNTVQVARELLGKFLVRRYPPTRKRSGLRPNGVGGTVAYMITEVEAYDGFKDKASHAHRGKTERNKIMFGEAGHWYVYFIYGMHWMLNIVTGPKEYPAAVLIRGIEGINGPARLTKALHINDVLNGKKANKKSNLWIESQLHPPTIGRQRIKKSPRIGVDYAGYLWTKKQYRFFLQ